MPNLRDFHWCFINERIDLDSVRRLSNLLGSCKWNSVCLYIIDEEEMRPDDPEELEVELMALYEDKRVKRYQVFNVMNWTSALFRHWTKDWVGEVDALSNLF
jgi:hypothetical protein